MGEQVWQPIETAPKDGTEILVCEVTRTTPFMQVVQWQTYTAREGGDWFILCGLAADPDLYFTPTHWMPLPTPPGPQETV